MHRFIRKRRSGCEHHITDANDSPDTIAHSLLFGDAPPPVYFNQKFAMGFDNPFGRRSLCIAASAGAGGALARPTDYNLTKQCFLVVCSLVLLCNSVLKWINLRSYDRFQKILYLSLFLNAIFILCLLAVSSEKMTPFALLGSMTFFCVLQVAVDLAGIYFGAYGSVIDLKAWARSTRSSIDLGRSFALPTRWSFQRYVPCDFIGRTSRGFKLHIGWSGRWTKRIERETG